MRKSVVIATAFLGMLAFAMFVPTVQATHIYVAEMAIQNDGEAYARASTGASCYIRAAARWTVVDANNVKLGVHFADYTYITGSIWTTLDAPGWADEAYFRMNVYHDGIFMGGTGVQSTQTYWQGYQWAPPSNWIIGPGGEWKFIIDVWGLDWGSQTCGANKAFTVYNV